MFQIFAYQTQKEVINLNWTAWLWGCVVAMITGSITAVTAWGQFPNATELQLFLIVYPAIAGSFLAFLMKSPFPGSTGITPLPPEGGAVK